MLTKEFTTNNNETLIVGFFTERNFDGISNKWVMRVYYKYNTGKIDLIETFSFDIQKDVDNAIVKFIEGFPRN